MQPITISALTPNSIQAANINHVFVVDMSGSMYSALPKMADHLKNRLAMMVKAGDTFSIIYFSGRNQCGSIFTGMEIASLADLSDIHAAIDRHFRTIGLTSFVEPLEVACTIGEKLTNENGNSNSLIFMTDGYDNTNTRDLIMSKCEDLPNYFDTINFMEFGYYADHDMILRMAEAVSGSHMFTETTQSFNDQLEEVVMNGNFAKKVRFEAPSDANAAFYFVNDTIVTPKLQDGGVFAPETAMVYFINTESGGWKNAEATDLYAVLYYAVHTNNNKLVWELLSALGDVYLIQQFATTFTKQQVVGFKEKVMAAFKDPMCQFIEGQDYDAVPDKNAPTIFNLIDVLVENNALLLTRHPSFKYNRIGAGSTPVEVMEGYTPKFVANDDTGAVELNRIVMNESRPNISIGTVQSGYVDIPAEAAAEHNIPVTRIPTVQHRNYTLVRDGIINVKTLPVVVDNVEQVKNTLTNNKVSFTTVPHNSDLLIIKLDSVPLINLSMTESLCGHDMAVDFCEGMRMKATHKVIKHFRDLYVGRVNNQKLADEYGDDGANWLADIGIRDYGFSPKVISEKSGDVYMGYEFNIKVKGLSSLPSISALEKKLKENKKLNLADSILFEEYDAVRSIINKLIYNKEQSKIDQTLLGIEERVKAQVRELNAKTAKMVYGIILGKSWPVDVSRETPELQFDYATFRTKATFELTEKEFTI